MSGHASGSVTLCCGLTASAGMKTSSQNESWLLAPGHGAPSQLPGFDEVVGGGWVVEDEVVDDVVEEVVELVVEDVVLEVVDEVVEEVVLEVVDEVVELVVEEVVLDVVDELLDDVVEEVSPTMSVRSRQRSRCSPLVRRSPRRGTRVR